MVHRFRLTDIIEQEDFTGVVIESIQRRGKTSYAMQVLYDLYGDWEMVFTHMVHPISELVDTLTKLVDENRQVPALIWDDATVHGSSQMYWKDKELYDYLGSLTDVIGTTTKALVITTPNYDRLVKTIRGYDWIKVKIIKTGGYNGDGRRAKGYQILKLPDGKRKIKRLFEDDYVKLLPDKVYQRYQQIRNGYNKGVLETARQKWKEAKLIREAQLAKASNYLTKQEQEQTR